MDGLMKIKKAFMSLKWYEILMCIVMFCISIYYAILPQVGTPQWLAIINFISGLCGIICVFFCAKANRMNFPFAVVNTVVYMIYLFYFGIWGTFWLEALIYMPMNIISWRKWYQYRDEENELLAKSKTLTPAQHVIVVGIIAGIATFVHYALTALTGNTWMNFAIQFGWNVAIVQWLDSFVFAIGVVATGLELLRYKEQYVWWIITNFIAITQYILKGDPVYITKKVIYQIEAIIGIRNWHLLSKKNKENI